MRNDSEASSNRTLPWEAFDEFKDSELVVNSMTLNGWQRKIKSEMMLQSVKVATRRLPGRFAAICDPTLDHIELS
jgi:hypothetical protein